MTNKPYTGAFELYEYLKKIGFKPETARYIIAQMAHETGNFTSMLYRRKNNPFGMKEALKRKTTDIDEGPGADKIGYSEYKTIWDALEDYKLYYQSFGYPATFKDVSTFVKALKKNNYFEAPLEAYSKAVEYWYNIYWG